MFNCTYVTCYLFSVDISSVADCIDRVPMRSDAVTGILSSLQPDRDIRGFMAMSSLFDS